MGMMRGMECVWLSPWALATSGTGRGRAWARAAGARCDGASDLKNNETPQEGVSECECGTRLRFRGWPSCR